MAKLFYSLDEAASKLGVSPEQVKQFVADNRLRELKDGAKVLFKVDAVNALAEQMRDGTATPLDGDETAAAVDTFGGSDSGLDFHATNQSNALDDSLNIEEGTGSGSGLALQASSSDTSTLDAITPGSSGDTTESSGIAGLIDEEPKKDGTTVAGVKGATKGGSGSSQTGTSVFDPGEVKASGAAAESGAQTQIQSAVDEQDVLSLEGVGSGSGLLDLTRESDDTSLGAELLDEIYPGETNAKSEGNIGSSSGIFQSTTVDSGDGGVGTGVANLPIPSGLDTIIQQTTPQVQVAAVVEAVDPMADTFGGMAAGAVAAMVVTSVIVYVCVQNYSPSWLESLTESTTNAYILLGVLAFFALVTTVVGFFAGKAGGGAGGASDEPEPLSLSAV